MSKEKSFSAFPCAAFGPTENDFIHQRGMTMRDWFAGMAMQGICSHNDTWGQSTLKAVSFLSYEIADEMMARMQEGKK